MDLLSVIAGFLAGIAATYLLSFFLSSDTKTQAPTPPIINNNILSEQLWQAHEKLLKEMKQDLSNPDFQFHREFFVTKKGWDWNRFGFHRQGPRLVYFIEDHIDLPRQLETLTSNGLIKKIDEKNGKFQLVEKFAEWLRRK
ncbi:MAG: hypothetical protein RQ714_02610 [Nitrosomonas sp.]|nr:hypothetical protein [Nitrosomonas sp.]